MAARRKRSRDSSPEANRQHGPQRRTTLAVRRVRGEDAWELVHPPCAMERADDLEEVEQMLDAGETAVAREELLWLVDSCRDFVAAHRLLAELALEAGDMPLARAHFGYAYQLGADALPPGGLSGLLPHRLAANRPFLESAKGLAWCLIQLGKPDKARPILDQLLSFEPSDPLGAAAMRAGLG